MTISTIDLFLSNQEIKFDYNDYFTGLMQAFYIVDNPITSCNLIILTDTIFTISTKLFAYSNYDIVLGVSNVFGSSNFTLHVTDYEKAAPTVLNSTITFELSNVNIHYNIDSNVYSNSLLQYYEIQSELYDGIVLDNNIISIYHCNVERTCNITIAVGNVWDSNTFTITINEWEHVAPKYIDDISTIDLFLSNQEIQFDYNDYFTGLMQAFYIVDNPITSCNLIVLTDTIFTISTKLYEYSNYDIVLGVSNVYGLTEVQI